MEDKFYLHALNLLPQFGPKRLLKLANAFASFKDAFEASSKALATAGLEPQVIEAFLGQRENIDVVNEANSLTGQGISLLTFKDDNYPKLLLEIPLFPPLLYYKGTMDNADELAIAVVGTRKITNYGRTVIPELLEPLCQSGITIVSGLAYGADAAAHTVALKTGSRTIAVLGSGLDDKTIYPKDHALLAEQIISSGGALLSEHPPGTPAFKQHFVARNRILSGLCVATVVVECDTHSGALITAGHALDQNRNVYAVPGPIYSLESRGPNNLLKMGAKPLTEAADILDDLNLSGVQLEITDIGIDLTEEEQKIFEHINFEPIGINELIKKAELEAGQVTATLTFLEMKGKIRNLGAQQYVRSRK